MLPLEPMNLDEFLSKETEQEAIDYLAYRHYTRDILSLPYEVAADKIKDANTLNRLYNRKWESKPLSEVLNIKVMKFLIDTQRRQRETIPELMSLTLADFTKLIEMYVTGTKATGDYNPGDLHFLSKSLKPIILVGSKEEYVQFRIVCDELDCSPTCNVPHINHEIVRDAFLGSSMKVRAWKLSAHKSYGIELIRHITGYENIRTALSGRGLRELYFALFESSLTDSLSPKEKEFMLYNLATREVSTMVNDAPRVPAPHLLEEAPVINHCEPLGISRKFTFMSSGDGAVTIENYLSVSAFRSLLSGEIECQCMSPSMGICSESFYETIWKINVLIVNGIVSKGPYFMFRGRICGDSYRYDKKESFPYMINTDLDCPVCYETKTTVKFQCGHHTCLECFPNIGDLCPLCRRAIILSRR